MERVDLSRDRRGPEYCQFKKGRLGHGEVRSNGELQKRYWANWTRGPIRTRGRFQMNKEKKQEKNGSGETSKREEFGTPKNPKEQTPRRLNLKEKSQKLPQKHQGI